MFTFTKSENRLSVAALTELQEIMQFKVPLEQDEEKRIVVSESAVLDWANYTGNITNNPETVLDNLSAVAAAYTLGYDRRYQEL